MERIPRKACTYEFKLEAVRLVESNQTILQRIPWYNQNRSHSTIGYQSPAEFEQA